MAGQPGNSHGDRALDQRERPASVLAGSLVRRSRRGTPHDVKLDHHAGVAGDRRARVEHGSPSTSSLAFQLRRPRRDVRPYGP
jgi:hypothetical protein